MSGVNNSIYIRRRGRIALPESAASDGPLLPLNYVTSVTRNLETLGYGFSERLIEACRRLSLGELTALYLSLIDDLKRLRGAHRTFQPMYPNFPAQVMEASESELYFNALVHYWSGGRLLPITEIKERFPLLDETELDQIDLGSREEFEGLLAKIAGSNTSLSEQDREDLTWFVTAYGDNIGSLLPPSVPQKENFAILASLLIAHTSRADTFLQAFCRTATDVLRLAVGLSDGDVSLAENTKFRTFTRPERRLLLSLLEKQARGSGENITEDMLRHTGRWVRLGERLHPGEHARKYPLAAQAFQVLRNDLPFATFNSTVERSLAARNMTEATRALKTRPGDLARRLDHLLRISDGDDEAALTDFGEAAASVSTPVLLQVRHHFLARNAPKPLRVFFPKGNLAKAYGIPNNLADHPLSEALCSRVATICEEALLERFRALEPLGRVYVSPGLTRFPVPFAMRSASKAMRTLVRGSKLDLPENCQTLRFFVWWKNGTDRTDIDLSAAMLNADFRYIDLLSYYNLKSFGGAHSGDIVDAPEGASEFIDVSLSKLREQGVRYVAMTLHSYTNQPYCDLPECFAGWMAREHAESGEIYEPKTVKDRLDITANTRAAVPLVIDIAAHQVIWCDIAIGSEPRWVNNVHTTLVGINLTVQALTDLEKPDLYELFVLHARARGELVASPDEADTVFSLDRETPFHIEEIAARYMG